MFYSVNFLFFVKFRWKFAYKCVLEEDVRRIHRNWDWIHMSSHRKLIKEYSILYRQKLESKKPSTITLNRISELENNLDVMNIILTRQRVENIVRIFLCKMFNYILIGTFFKYLLLCLIFS